MTITIESIEEAVREYGRACSDVTSASEWGTGVKSAESEKEEAFQRVMKMFQAVVKQTEKDNITVCENCQTFLRGGECENCSTPYKDEKIVRGLRDARNKKQTIFDNWGEEWYYYEGKIKLTSASLESPEDQEENGYGCKWDEARLLLVKFGYIS